MAEVKQRELALLEDFYDSIKTYTEEIPAKTEKVEKLYDDWAETYEQDYSDVGFMAAATAGTLMKEYFQDNIDQISVIDCGAGTGLVAEELLKHGFSKSKIVGVDISEKCMDLARKKQVYSELIRCVIGKDRMPFNDNDFTALISSGSIGHTHIGPEAFPEWVRIVKPGGIVLIITRREEEGGESGLVKKFNEDFEKMIHHLEMTKKWKLVEERVIPEYVQKKDGVAYIFKIL